MNSAASASSLRSATNANAASSGGNRHRRQRQSDRSGASDEERSSLASSTSVAARDEEEEEEGPVGACYTPRPSVVLDVSATTPPIEPSYKTPSAGVEHVELETFPLNFTKLVLEGEASSSPTAAAAASSAAGSKPTSGLPGKRVRSAYVVSSSPTDTGRRVNSAYAGVSSNSSYRRQNPRYFADEGGFWQKPAILADPEESLSLSPRVSDFREPSPLPNSVVEEASLHSAGSFGRSVSGGGEGNGDDRRGSYGRRVTIEAGASERKTSSTGLSTSNVRRKTSFAQAYEESVAATLGGLGEDNSSASQNPAVVDIMTEDAERRGASDWNHHGDDDAVCNAKVKIWSVLGTVVVVVGILIAVIVSSVHKVNEGNVGIYYKHGALLDAVSHPGVHWMAPFVTEVREVSIRPQTDTLRPVSSITRDGIQNKFMDLQVISDVKSEALIRLIRKFGIKFKEALVYDRIREELRIFCANHTIDEVYNTMFLEIVDHVKARVEDSIERLGGGVKLLNLVIPKPEIPPDIAANYKQVKVQWTEQLVATQQQKTEQIKKETESIKAVADANRQKAVLTIELEKQVLQKEGERNLSLLENEIVRKREESNADVAAYKKEKAAQANTQLYTKEYVQLEMAKALSNNTKFYFSGQDSALGSLLSNVLGRA